jgi:cell division protein ZipA
MEQLSIRDWMIIIGGMMIAGVLLDAVRRYWRERRAELKLNARIERASPGEQQPFNLLTELPNGGARIIRRGDLSEGLEPNEWEPLDDEEPRDRPDGSSNVAVSEPVIPDPIIPDPSSRPIDVAVQAEVQKSEAGATAASAPVETGAAKDASEQSEPTAAPSEPPAAGEGSRRRTVKPLTASDGASANPKSNDSGTVDWLESIETNESDLPEHGRLPRGANTHVFILYVVARQEDGFAGGTILETLLTNDLRFGDMDFFHRHERTSGRGAIEFSVANMMKPGVFDIDNMEPLQTRGLMFFVTLPGPTDMLKAFDYMYETAKLVAKSLDGDIQDETRSVVTRQSLEHMRQQIRELERRLLVRRT